MANLKALREKIKNITDYTPQLQQYDEQLDELINDAYQHIWSEKRWSWATKEYLFKFIPDVLPTRDTDNVIAPATEVRAQVTKGSRQVTFNFGMDRLTKVNFEGQPIEIQNYEYTISKVVSTSEILLDIPFHGTSSLVDTTWTIKRRYYDLPQDSIELLNLSHRDIPNSNSGTGRFPPYGQLIGLMPRRDEQLNLRMDYKASYAEAFVWSPSFFVPEGQTTSLSSEPAGSGFPANGYIEVCWAFVRDGHVGALSEPTVHQFGAIGPLTLTISFESWDAQPIAADAFQSFDTSPTQYEGLDKIVFWNANFNRTTGERLGLPVWKVFNNPTGSAVRNTTTYLNPVIAADTASSVTITNFNQIDPGNEVYVEIDGQYNRIRPYPRVDAWDEEVTQKPADLVTSKVPQDFLREGVARYYYKPPTLAFATDSPQMPHEFHQLIVYKVLETLYSKSGQDAKSDMYRRRYESEMKQLKKRYADHIDSMVQRGQFQLGGNRWFVYDYASLKTGG